ARLDRCDLVLVRGIHQAGRGQPDGPGINDQTVGHDQPAGGNHSSDGPDSEQSLARATRPSRAAQYESDPQHRIDHAQQYQGAWGADDGDRYEGDDECAEDRPEGVRTEEQPGVATDPMAADPDQTGGHRER